MKLTPCALLLSLLSFSAIADCEEKYNLSLGSHNQAIDLHTLVAKSRDQADNATTIEEKCRFLKSAQQQLPETISAYEKCWKNVKKGIQACVHTPNVDAVVEAGDSCLKGSETSKEWAVSVKSELASTCKN